MKNLIFPYTQDMKKLSLLILIALVSPVLLPIGESFHTVKRYTYASEEQVQELSFREVLEPTASLGTTTSATFWKESTGTLRFSSPQDMFVVKIPKVFPLEPGAGNIQITLRANGESFPLALDLDGDSRREDFYYTEPIFLEKTREVSYIIETKNTLHIPAISLVGLDTESHSTSVAFGVTEAGAAIGGNPNIMKRSEWGADETLRYADSPRWKAVFAKLEAEKDKPKSEATLKYEEKVRNIGSYLTTNFPEQEKAIETVREENGHELVWPIQRTKKVERIVIHHTAEGNQKNRDDLTLIRGIYYYHAIVRGWGDIGYNYLVGQRGQIYEGRAGGDYTAAAHAVWNNKSSVGVSFMGNFTTDNVVVEQENTLKQIVEHLSKKYGIDIHKTSTGHKECSSKESCLLKDFAVPNLSGHKEVGFTSCPGDNLFALVENLRKVETASIGRKYTLHPNHDSIQIASL